MTILVAMTPQERQASCCRAFVLSTSLEEIAKARAKFVDADFVIDWVRPLGVFDVNPVSGYKYSPPRQLYGCLALGRDGRCTQYQNRPRMCRRFACTGPWSCDEFKGCTSLGNGCTGTADVLP